MDPAKKLADGYVSHGYVHGLHLYCVKDGKVVLDYGAGWADEEKTMKMTKDTIFRCYSMTKPVVAVAIMMLKDEGLLDIDDPVSKHVPEWRDEGKVVHKLDGTIEPAKRPVTLRDLLTHTSGIDYGFWPEGLSKVAQTYRELALDLPHDITGHNQAKLPPPVSLKEFCERLQKVPLCCQPGERFQYGMSLDVLGRVVECLTGSLNAFLKTRIFDPLGMVDTDFVLPKEKLARFAQCFSAEPHPQTKAPAYKRVPKPIGSNDETSSYLPGGLQEKCPSGGGGLVTTAADYAKFAKTLLTGEADGVRLLKAESLEMMRTDNMAMLGAERTSLAALFEGVGLGLAVAADKGTSLGGSHAGKGTVGWGGAANTFFVADPVNKVVIVVTSQLLSYNATVPTMRPFLMETCYRSMAGEDPDISVAFKANAPGAFSG